MGGDDADFKLAGALRRFDFRHSLSIATSIPTTRYRSIAPAAEVVIMERSGHFPFLEEREGTM